MDIQYKIKRQLEKFGNLELEIECLEDLNQTIDDVFRFLESRNDPQALEELCPYFGVVWPAARGLSEYLVALPSEQLFGRRVLELGCGLAIPSIVADKRGAVVTATDFHPMVPAFLENNIRLNEVKNLEYLHVNWEKEAVDLQPYDWVIGSDILYEGRFPASLSKAITDWVRPEGKVVIADPGRPYLQGFVDEMKRRGFQCKTEIFKVPHPPHLQEVFILTFQRKA